MQAGKPHILTSTINEIIGYLSDYGFSTILGPELETEYYNFDALNILEKHPAREMWDTFWIKDRDDLLLRTHTSPMQIRYMEKHAPPIKIIVPGKVFRNETTDATHEAQFYQLEGLCIGRDVTLADMKAVIEGLIKKLFGERVELRYRPSFFPFTEPSLEVDMKLKRSVDWIEILGCGMVNRKLLSRTGISSKKYSGYAFGIGIDRIVKLRYDMEDIRILYKGDLRFINQF